MPLPVLEAMPPYDLDVGVAEVREKTTDDIDETISTVIADVRRLAGEVRAEACRIDEHVMMLELQLRGRAKDGIASPTLRIEVIEPGAPAPRYANGHRSKA